MKTLNYDLINRQISKFERESELDYEEVLDYYNHQILKDMTYPFIILAFVEYNINILYLLEYYFFKKKINKIIK